MRIARWGVVVLLTLVCLVTATRWLAADGGRGHPAPVPATSGWVGPDADGGAAGLPAAQPPPPADARTPEPATAPSPAAPPTATPATAPAASARTPE